MARKILSFMLVLCFLMTSLGFGYRANFFDLGNVVFTPITKVVDSAVDRVESFLGLTNEKPDGEFVLIRYPLDRSDYYIDFYITGKTLGGLFTPRERLARGEKPRLLYSNYPNNVFFEVRGFSFFTQYIATDIEGETIFILWAGDFAKLPKYYDMPSYEYYEANVMHNPHFSYADLYPM